MLLALTICYTVTLVYLSITERFRHYATIIAVQGWLLLAIALLRLQTVEWYELLFIMAETLLFKAVVMPAMLFRIIRRTGINRVHPASASVFNQLIFSIAALVCSIVITYYIADTNMNMIFFGVALYALLSGMLLIPILK